MVVSKMKNFVYVQIPHTGSTSMAIWLRRHFGGNRILSKHSWRIPKPHRSCFKFTMVRNPYERMFTWWWFGLERDEYKPTFEEFMEFMLERKEVAKVGEGKDGKLQIPEFYTPQVRWVRDIPADQWIRLEDIGGGGALASLPFTDKRIPKFPHRNKTETRPRVPFLEYFTEGQARMVLEHSGEDFEAFGYDKGIR